jgi:hypothetical protein
MARTSVYLNKERTAAVAASGKSLLDLIDAGLAAVALAEDLAKINTENPTVTYTAEGQRWTKPPPLDEVPVTGTAYGAGGGGTSTPGATGSPGAKRSAPSCSHSFPDARLVAGVRVCRKCG